VKNNFLAIYLLRCTNITVCTEPWFANCIGLVNYESKQLTKHF